jgi:endonuclease/exonuclease/phosphatase family metal-dependent hydrolase
VGARVRLTRYALLPALAVVLAACAQRYDVALAPTARSCPVASADAVSWYVPTGTDRHSDADRWCRSVGPAVFEPEPAARFGPWGSAEPLVTVAWNVNGGSGDLYRFLETELGLDCASGDPYAGPPFVLLVQEAFRRSPDVPPTTDRDVIPPRMKEPERDGSRDDIVRVAERCGLAIAYVAATRNGPEGYDGEREDKGNAVLATLPLAEPLAIELPMVAQRRVTVGATVPLPSGAPLGVVSLHFNNYPTPWHVLRSGGSTRTQQARATLDGLRQIEAEQAGNGPVPAVGGGDLNTSTTGEAALRYLYDWFTDSPPFHGEPTRSGFATDHLLLRGAGRLEVEDASYRRIDDDYGSDHHPVTFRVRVSGNAR